MSVELETCLWCENCPALKPSEWSNDCPAPADANFARLPTGEYKTWSLCLPCYINIFEGDSMITYDTYKQFRNKYFKTFEKYGVLKAKAKVPICLWYSVRPPEGTDEKKFIERMKKFMKSKSISKGHYQFEWKYDKDLKNRHGIHCHMLLYGTVKQINFHIKRQKEKYFNLSKKQKFWIYDREIVKDKEDYMEGDTNDEEKNAEKEEDKKTRIKFGLNSKINSFEN